MVRVGKMLLSLLVVLVLAGTSHAWTINFENGIGHDQEAIASDIPGLAFTNTAGFDWIYGDAASNNWNVRSEDGPTWQSATYWMDGQVFAFLGTSQGSGRIDFTNQDGGYFTTGYCAASNFYVEAYDVNDNLIDQAVGGANLYPSNVTGMGYLTVSSASNNIAYIILHDTGNFWLTDNMSGNATGVPDQGGPAVPEPATMLLMGLGLVGTGIVRKFRG